MSSDLAKVEDVPGLTTREYDLISRLYQICIWMGQEDEGGVRRLIMGEMRMKSADAEIWMQKAREYMALGVVEGVDVARAMCLYRLEQIHALCASRMVHTETEVVRRPMTVYGKGGAKVTEDREVTKVRPDVLDSIAVSGALRTIREIALVSGVIKPSKKTQPITIEQFNQQVNNPTPGPPTTESGLIPAARLSELSDQDLASLLGAEVNEQAR